MEKNPLDLFYEGCKSPDTKERYTRYLSSVLCDIYETVLEGTFQQRANQFVRKAKKDPDWTINLLLALAKKLKERTSLPKEDKNYLNPSSFGNYFKPLKKLLDMNGVPVVWKRIYATFPEQDNNSEGRGYEREEIAQLLDFAKGPMDKTIMLIASSSGIREGGMRLKWQDVIPVYKIDDDIRLEITESQEKNAKVICAILKIYEGTSSFYPAFITPEAYHSLQNWHKTWTMDVGREPKPTEPVFKKEGDLPIMLEPTAIKARIEKVLKKSGFRTPLTKDKRRHEIPVMNGFRRFFNKMNKNSISKDSPLGALIKKENMMGHTGLIKLDKNYFKTHVLELVEEYLNAVPNLTIDNAERKEAENIRLKKQLEIRESDAQKILRLKIEELTKQVEETKANQAKQSYSNALKINNSDILDSLKEEIIGQLKKDMIKEGIKNYKENTKLTSI
ncbi:MAG TPA: integrase [Candidatus Nitrosotalea sp.]|nr:integrase [Candidatus Nitrosotalea sp.]